MIDVTGFLSSGGFAEVAPDVVLYGYGGTYQPAGIRVQLIRVDKGRERVQPLSFDHPQFERVVAGEVDVSVLESVRF